MSIPSVAEVFDRAVWLVITSCLIGGGYAFVRMLRNIAAVLKCAEENDANWD